MSPKGRHCVQRSAMAGRRPPPSARCSTTAPSSRRCPSPWIRTGPSAASAASAFQDQRAGLPGIALKTVEYPRCANGRPDRRRARIWHSIRSWTTSSTCFAGHCDAKINQGRGADVSSARARGQAPSSRATAAAISLSSMRRSVHTQCPLTARSGHQLGVVSRELNHPGFDLLGRDAFQSHRAGLDAAVTIDKEHRVFTGKNGRSTVRSAKLSGSSNNAFATFVLVASLTVGEPMVPAFDVCYESKAGISTTGRRLRPGGPLAAATRDPDAPRSKLTFELLQ
jgi:hypothetical protein